MVLILPLTAISVVSAQLLMLLQLTSCFISDWAGLFNFDFPILFTRRSHIKEAWYMTIKYSKNLINFDSLKNASEGSFKL